MHRIHIWDYKERKNKQLFVSSSSSLYLYLDTTTINVNHIRQLIEWHHSVERVYILKMQTCKKNKAQMSRGLWRKRTEGRRFRSSHFLFLSACLFAYVMCGLFADHDWNMLHTLCLRSNIIHGTQQRKYWAVLLLECARRGKETIEV
jgi:hypothetical protein